MLLIALGIGVVVALIVGLSTLRLSGVYFVIFTFGLAELVRQLVTWYEVNKTRTLGRYVFADITAAQIYWQLLALAVLVFAAGILIGRSRLGPRAARHRRRRDGGAPCRHRHHPRQGRAVRAAARRS